jgi:hypothetical protein
MGSLCAFYIYWFFSDTVLLLLLRSFRPPYCLKAIPWPLGEMGTSPSLVLRAQRIV